MHQWYVWPKLEVFCIIGGIRKCQSFWLTEDNRWKTSPNFNWFHCEYLFKNAAYFATFATFRVAAIAQATYDSNWLDLPPRLQKFKLFWSSLVHKKQFILLDLVYFAHWKFLEKSELPFFSSCKYYRIVFSFF